MARYAVLLHGIMLRELSKPLPQITEIYLNCRIQENSPDPKTVSYFWVLLLHCYMYTIEVLG